jgi:two-component system, chemotaxis family, protein-glutamate methylesterase/glutaminase
MTRPGNIRVLVVDDSALIRSVLSSIINAQPDMEVVGTAPNPIIAREKIVALDPDVLTLDIEMPLMNGLEFLQRLMAAHPMPVLMVSTLTESGGDITLRALELGAFDFISKPQLGIEQGLQAYAEEICGKLRSAVSARRSAVSRVALRAPLVPASPLPRSSTHSAPQRLIMVGASTGGTEAIRHFLQGMPGDCPGILIVQHMPENFTRSFAQRLNNLTALTVCEAHDGQAVLPGHAYVAPGHSHLKVIRGGGGYQTQLSQAELVNRHRPSVDVLFHSAAEVLGAQAAGVILTGMGRDGAIGLLAMRKSGAATFAQDEASCVVFGMPREAIALQAASEVVPLEDMAARVLHSLPSRRAGS